MSIISNDDIGKQFRGALADASSGRFDSRMVTFADANYLQSEAILYPCMSVIPTSDGFGFVKDRRKRRNAENTDWIEEDLTKHLHHANSDEAGGLLSDIELQNQGNTLRALLNTYNKNIFYPQVSGTGAEIVDNVSGTVGRVAITAGTTTNGYANGSVFGVQMDFQNDSALMMAFELEGTLTNYLMKAGIAAEMINDVNSTTQESYGIESCSASGTNILIFSCKPPSRSTVISGYTADNDLHSWFLRHSVANGSVFLDRDIDFANTVEKTDDIPISGRTPYKALYGNGIKTTNTTSKSLWFYGATILGSYGATIWRHYAQDIA